MDTRTRVILKRGPSLGNIEWTEERRAAFSRAERLAKLHNVSLVRDGESTVVVDATAFYERRPQRSSAPALRLIHGGAL